MQSATLEPVPEHRTTSQWSNNRAPSRSSSTLAPKLKGHPCKVVLLIFSGEILSAAKVWDWRIYLKRARQESRTMYLLHTS